MSCHSHFRQLALDWPSLVFDDILTSLLHRSDYVGEILLGDHMVPGVDYLLCEFSLGSRLVLSNDLPNPEPEIFYWVEVW